MTGLLSSCDWSGFSFVFRKPGSVFAVTACNAVISDAGRPERSSCAILMYLKMVAVFGMIC
ncbi:MAG TPA: hypothetical protein DIT89_03755 [Planctomycetaceae bacterium]|nr:hypothetical protein [Planctomycetaceae bacterium]